MMTFDKEFARLLLEICRYTYAAAFNDTTNSVDKQDALHWITKTGNLLTAEPTMLQGKGSATSIACVTSYPDLNIVSYMGTKTQFDTLGNATATIKDWSQNFEALLVPFKLTSEQLGTHHPKNVVKEKLAGLVHKGFLEELAAVQGSVVETLMERGGKSQPLHVTGHSQGGAEAVLATSALLAAGFTVRSTYTFAAPRAGNVEFAKSIPTALPIHRLEFGDDIVPHVPPTLINTQMKKIAEALKSLPFISDQSKMILNLVLHADEKNSFTAVGRLCYGSQKTKALRVDISAEQEAALFYDRLWSLVRHPERWAEHHHLAGTTKEVRSGVKGNYTSLVSDFSIVS